MCRHNPSNIHTSIDIRSSKESERKTTWLAVNNYSFYLLRLCIHTPILYLTPQIKSSQCWKRGHERSHIIAFAQAFCINYEQSVSPRLQPPSLLVMDNKLKTVIATHHQKHTTPMSPKEGGTDVCGSFEDFVILDYWEAITGCHFNRISVSQPNKTTLLGCVISSSDLL